MNFDLGKTKITELVRVSSAAIFYENTPWGVAYFQYETFIFSSDPNFKTRQIIWGSSSGEIINDDYIRLTQRGHNRVQKIMSKKLK